MIIRPLAVLLDGFYSPALLVCLCPEDDKRRQLKALIMILLDTCFVIVVTVSEKSHGESILLCCAVANMLKCHECVYCWAPTGGPSGPGGPRSPYNNTHTKQYQCELRKQQKCIMLHILIFLFKMNTFACTQRQKLRVLFRFELSYS